MCKRFELIPHLLVVVFLLFGAVIKPVLSLWSIQTERPPWILSIMGFAFSSSRRGNEPPRALNFFHLGILNVTFPVLLIYDLPAATFHVWDVCAAQTQAWWRRGVGDGDGDGGGGTECQPASKPATFASGCRGKGVRAAAACPWKEWLLYQANIVS